MLLYPRLHSGVRAADDDPTKAEAIRDGIRAGDEEMRLSLFHQQLGAHRASPERVKKADDETAELIQHFRAKWKGTKYEKDFEDAFARQMKDPTYRDKAFAPPRVNKWWKLPDLNLGIDWTSPISIMSVVLVVGVLIFAIVMIGLAVESSHHMPNPIPRRGKPAEPMERPITLSHAVISQASGTYSTASSSASRARPK